MCVAVGQLIVYDYAIVGLWWFGSKLEAVPSDVYSIGADANFTTFFNSVALLFQLMVGESWNDVMVAAIYATHSLAPMWYFVSYIILLLLLLANVLTGIICDRFSVSDHAAWSRLRQRPDRALTRRTTVCPGCPCLSSRAGHGR